MDITTHKSFCKYCRKPLPCPYNCYMEIILSSKLIDKSYFDIFTETVFFNISNSLVRPFVVYTIFFPRLLIYRTNLKELTPLFKNEYHWLGSWDSESKFPEFEYLNLEMNYNDLICSNCGKFSFDICKFEYENFCEICYDKIINDIIEFSGAQIDENDDFS